MTAAVVINGQVLAEQVRIELRDKIALLDKTPELAVVLVGHNPASEIYVKAKERACAEVGMISSQHRLEEDASEEDVLDLIDALNHNRDVTGILVQLPLPKHLDEKRVLAAIAPEKDVDGFHPLNTGCMMQKRKDAFVPCTPKGIMKIVHYAKDDISGLHAVVVGRSQIVGLPVAHLLLQDNCTVTVAHSKTKNLPAICKQADILVVAVGKPEFITKDYITKNNYYMWHYIKLKCINI